MRRLLQRLPRSVPSLIVGAVIALAVIVAIGHLWIALAVGGLIAVVLLWEERMH